MRSISANGLAKLAQRYGTEPVVIVEVDWTDEGPSAYADRAVGHIPGRIVECGDLDNVVNVGNNTGSQELTIVLDDTDGTIKAIMDRHDVHKRPARVYQYFTGLAVYDRFLLFSGKVNTPITWNERDRTVTLTIVSQLEDREIGFSAEEGQFPYLPADLVGKPWPMIFGKVINCPALQINQAVKGTTLTGVGIVSGVGAWNSASQESDDSDFLSSLAMTQVQAGHLSYVSSAWLKAGIDDATGQRYLDQYNAIREQLGMAVARYQQQRMCEARTQSNSVSDAESKGNGENPMRVLGGEDFPQNQTITVKVNSGLFTGRFNGEYFTIYERSNPDDEKSAEEAAATRSPACSIPETGDTHFDFQDPVPGGVYRTQGWLFSTGWSGRANQSSDPIARQFWAEPGATVTMASDEAITYIASIVPGRVLAVKAYKQLTGERRLTNVPTDWYTVNTQTYGTVTAVQVVLSKSLSSRSETAADGSSSNPWTDDLYITFESDVGPNTVDILKYLIDNYTDLTYDEATFAHVRTRLQPFPANFPILDRKNAIQVLQEIAFQARCAIWINNGVFYLKYLPEVPTSNDTITVSDIDAEGGISVNLTPTEDLVTKMVIKWRLSWAAESDRPKDTNEKTIILRHNVAKYGTHEEEYDFYIYNQPDIIYKCATFWLIRKANTWKRIAFKTFLNKLNLETFDAVTLQFAQPYVASNAVLSVVEKASYNSADNVVEMECLVPVRSGELERYEFFWPADLPTTALWPPQSEREEGNAGGGGIGTGATGDLPVGDTSTISRTIFVGGPNIVFGANADYGDRSPTDVGFTAQPVVAPTSYDGLVNGRRPTLNLRVLIPKKMSPLKTMQGAADVVIDIRKTQIYDSAHPGNEPAHLDSLIKKIENARLVLDGDGAQICTEEHGEPATFDFKFDEDTGVFGAGTAFLQD